MAKQRSEWAEKRIKEAREKSKDIEPSGFEPEEQAAELLAQCREAFPGLLQKQITIKTPIMLWKAKYLIGQCEALYEHLTGKPKLQIAHWRRALEKNKLDCFVTYGIEPGSNQDWERVGVALEKSLKNLPAQEPEAIGGQRGDEWANMPKGLSSVERYIYKVIRYTRYNEPLKIDAIIEQVSILTLKEEGETGQIRPGKSTVSRTIKALREIHSCPIEGGGKQKRGFYWSEDS